MIRFSGSRRKAEHHAAAGHADVHISIAPFVLQQLAGIIAVMYLSTV